MVMNQPDLKISDTLSVSRDQRTNAFEYPYMNDLVNKLKVCPLDPELCEFRFLDCKFHKDTVLLDIDFEDTYKKFIDTYHNKCPSLPKVYKVTDKRKRAIRFLLNWIN